MAKAGQLGHAYVEKKKKTARQTHIFAFPYSPFIHVILSLGPFGLVDKDDHIAIQRDLDPAVV